MMPEHGANLPGPGKPMAVLLPPGMEVDPLLWFGDLREVAAGICEMAAEFLPEAEALLQALEDKR